MINITSEGNLFTSFCNPVAGTASFHHFAVTALFLLFIHILMLKLKEFPLTLKDKAKIWLNSLRPRTIRNWAELQAEFLKSFFSAHKTNNLKRQI